MSLLADFARVTRRRPCPVCQRTKYCMVDRASPDDPARVLCTKVESPRKWGEAGWLHRFGDRDRRSAPPRIRTVKLAVRPHDPRFAHLALQFTRNLASGDAERLAGKLGLTPGSLLRLGLGWARAAEIEAEGTVCRGSGCWSFPMRDGRGNIVGIRLRTPDGFKYSVNGGRQGLHIPTDLPTGRPLLLAEGPTDTAALLDLGFAAIGRPSCNGGERAIVALLPGLKPTTVVAVVAMVESDPGIELFHTPGGHDSEGYATITVGEHRETWAINSRAFKRWLQRQFYKAEGKAPGGQALSDALGVLAGKAIHEGVERPVFVRVAEREGAIFLDLADAQWRVVKVTASGWSTITSSESPVRFIRKRGMLALPEPQRGVSITRFRELVNLPGDEQWILVISWLVAALRPGRPVPILAINGEQGSCKSTLSRMLRALLDPNQAPLRSPPRDERDLVIAASNGLVVAYDNLSGIPAALSDAICRLATGGGFGTRELYTNDDEKLFDGMRPVLLNGIDDVATRADALDRALNVTLPVVPEEKRRDEAELWARFYELHAGLLGSLLDALAVALKRLPSTRIDRKPRMADFALLIVAAEPALPWESGAFLAAYQGNRGEANTMAIEASPIALPILAMLEEKGSWSGNAGELLALLEAEFTDERTRRGKDWPANRKAMGNDLRRIAPNLRTLGHTVNLPEKGKGHKKKRIIVLESGGEGRSARSASSACPPQGAAEAVPGPKGADHAAPGADHAPATPPPHGPRSNPATAPQTPGADRADHADRVSGECRKDEQWGAL